jgi:hypothetical protein
MDFADLLEDDDDGGLALALEEDESDEEPPSVTELFDMLYSNHTPEVCKTASHEDRTKNNSRHPSLVFSEIDFESFMNLMLLAIEIGQYKPGGHFVDLGCGSGKAVFAAALAFDFAKCMGVEILPNLHSMTLELHAIWSDDIWYELSHQKKQTEINFIEGDVRVADWFEADFIFLNWTCFDDALKKTLRDQLEDLPEDAIVITTSEELVHEEFILIGQSKLKHTWGKSDVFISKKATGTNLADVSVDDLLASMSITQDM